MIRNRMEQAWHDIRARATPANLALTAAILAAVAFGVWQIGQGLYIKAKAELAQVLLEDAWGRALDGEVAPKPWPWADTWPVAKIAVPRLDEEAVILASASGQAMAFGPGHMSNTPAPGQRGISVISAHRDTHFRFLEDVTIGDRIVVTTSDGVEHRYTVTGSRVVRADASGIDPYIGNRQLALVTCWPFDAREQGPWRYVVFARQDGPSVWPGRVIPIRG